MKKYLFGISLLIGLVGGFLSFNCSNSKVKKIHSFKEKELSFIHLRHGFDINNLWIRQPENILMLHETFKSIGYEKLLARNYSWNNNPMVNQYAYINNSLENLVDSLEITYENYEEAPKYYREFWGRRKREQNDEAVYKVISEVKAIHFDNKSVSKDHSQVNDTLAKLLSFEYTGITINNEEANEALEYLIEIDLHQSAYNWIKGEFAPMENVTWKTPYDKMMSQLSENNSEIHIQPWFSDTNK